MEKSIEHAIDQGLLSISSELYLFSILFGVVLLLSGGILLITNKGSHRKKRFANGGLLCFVIGIIAIVSGFLQM